MQTQLRACFVCSVDSQFYTSAHNQSRREVKPKLEAETDGACQGLGRRTTGLCVLEQQGQDLASQRFCAKQDLNGGK